jgi:hypothetical protein
MSRPAHDKKPSSQVPGMHANVQPIGQPKRRLRWSNLPKPGSGEVPYAKSRPELAGHHRDEIVVVERVARVQGSHVSTSPQS